MCPGEDATNMVSMGTVWDRTTEFLSDNVSAIFPIAFLAIYLPGVVSSSLEPLTVRPGATAVTVQILSLVLALVGAWGQLAITALVLDPGGGRGVATALAGRRFLPLIGLLLILFAGLFVLMLPVPVALSLSGFDFQAAMAGGNAALPAGVGGFLSIYVLLLTVALLWLGARLALITPIVLKEGSGLTALRRSFTLTRPITWRILGVIVLYVVVFGVSVLAAKLVFGSIFRLIAGGDGPVTVGSVMTAILVGIVVTAFSVLASAFTGRLYLAARDAREAIVDSL